MTVEEKLPIKQRFSLQPEILFRTLTDTKLSAKWEFIHEADRI